MPRTGEGLIAMGLVDTLKQAESIIRRGKENDSLYLYMICQFGMRALGEERVEVEVNANYPRL